MNWTLWIVISIIAVIVLFVIMYKLGKRNENKVLQACKQFGLERAPDYETSAVTSGAIAVFMDEKKIVAGPYVNQLKLYNFSDIRGWAINTTYLNSGKVAGYHLEIRLKDVDLPKIEIAMFKSDTDKWNEILNQVCEA